MQGHRARKRFGQNFLVDAGVVEAIADAVAPHPGDRLVEIGPGLGALTRALLARIDPESLPLHAIEIDRDLVARLVRAHDRAALHLHEGDVLAFDFAALAAQLGGALRIVGNLPYNISSPLLFRLADVCAHVVDQHFMLQREVVDRMTAEPGSSEYGRLSVMLQLRYVMETVLDVAPEAFDPPPKVHSAVVRMVPRTHDAPRVEDETLFAQIVAAGYSQRRKMLRNTLGAYVALIGADQAATDLGVALTARAEDVAVEGWVALANRLAASRTLV